MARGNGAPVVLDIDGTLYDATPLMAECLARRHGIILVPAEYEDWNWWSPLLTPEELRRLIDDDFHSPEAILSAVPYEGAVAAVSAWQAAGHPIHVVSHRSPSKDAPTLAWLSAIGLSPDVFLGGHDVDKVAYAVSVGARLVVDDHADIIRAGAAAGLLPATIIHPYNRATLDSLGAAAIGAPDWPSLARRVAAGGALR